MEPQWQLLAANSSVNVSQLKTEDCLDGWTFDRSEFFATTVSEVTLAEVSVILQQAVVIHADKDSKKS